MQVHGSEAVPRRPPAQAARVPDEQVRSGTAQRVKAEFNAQVLSASAEVSLSAGNQPLHLLFRAAVEKLNETLAPELGEEGLQALDPADYTPEKVSERIVSFATGFLGAFRANHEGEPEGEVFGRFMATIREGIDQGFAEAREILKGLGVLQGDIEANIDRTYELISERLARFEEEHGPPPAPAEDAAVTQEPAAA